MCTQPECSGPDNEDPLVLQQWRDQSDTWLRETIRRHGWAVQAVLAEPDERQPGFSYTVGLWGFGHPELVVFGLSPGGAGALLNELGELVRAGAELHPGATMQGFPSAPERELRLVELPNAHDITLVAQELYRVDGGRVISALQVCWADEQGRYPWQPGFAYPRWYQPMPGTFAA